MKSIFEYIDFRQFLRDYYDRQKEQKKYFSYRFFAKKAGIKSPVFFKEVANGQKNLTRSMIDKFSTALAFNPKEAAYFKNIVLFEQAKSSQEKLEYYAILRTMEHIKSEKTLNPDQYDYFSNWYAVVIRELVAFFDFKDDYEYLGASITPPIKAREARAAVDLLLRLNLIEKTAQGSYRQTHTAITTQPGIASLAIRQFNRTMIERALGVLDDVPKTQRNVFGVTIGISQTMYEIICAEMAAFKDRLVTLVNRDQNSSRVYQLNMQLFPLSNDVAPPAKEVQ